MVWICMYILLVWDLDLRDMTLVQGYATPLVKEIYSMK